MRIGLVWIVIHASHLAWPVQAGRGGTGERKVHASRRGVVSASLADVHRDLDLLSEDEAFETDMSELLRARLAERLD